jgi:hypothetical protein
MADYKFTCEKCNFHTNYIQNYKRHLQTGTHQNGHRKDYTGPFKCNDCPYETENAKNFKIHILLKHSTEEKRKEELPYYCDICKFGTTIKSQYDKHILSNKHKKYTNIINEKAQE